MFLTETDVKPLTIKTYASSLKTFMEWFEETNNKPFSLDEIMPVDVAAYKRHLINQAKKPTTVNKHLTAIKAFCRWARDQGYIQDNPAAEVKALNLQRQAPK